MTILDKTDLSAMGTVQAETEPTGWQPIETAPEDEKILIFATPDWVDTAFWVLEEDSGEREWFWANARPIHRNFIPTHWQPLPDPPKE